MTDVRIIAGLLLLCLSACSDDIDKVKVVTEPHNLPIERGKNIEILYTDSGFKKALIRAPLLERYATESKTQTEMPEGIEVLFYDKYQRVESSLTAKYAVRIEKDRRMTARNDVVLVNTKGDTLRTEELHWDEVSQKIYSKQFVRITTPDEIIMGNGFESNPEFTQYRIHQISGTISLNK